MNSIPKWNYKIKANNVSFQGLNLAKANFSNFIKAISKSGLNDIYDSLQKEVLASEPGFLKETGREVLYKKATPLFDTITYPILKLPKVILSSIANKFNIESLKNSKILQNFERTQRQERAQRALRGLLKNGEEFAIKTVDEVASKTKNADKKAIINQINHDGCNYRDNKEIYKKALGEFYKLFDLNLAADKAKYHTPHERTITRLVSGGTAAIMLGSDFYNKSILNGKSEAEAEEELKGKRNQEFKATAMEAASQYLLLGAFSGYTNKSKWGAPIINTATFLMYSHYF